MIRVGMIICAVSILGLLMLSCAAGAKVPSNSPINLHAVKIVHTMNQLNTPDPIKPSPYKVPLPQTPYAALLESLGKLKDSLNSKPEGFDKSAFDDMFNDFNRSFRSDDYYSKNYFYIGLKHDIVHIERVRQIVRALKATGIAADKEAAEKLLIGLRDSGIYVSDVVEEDGQILSNANLSILQKSNNMEVINVVRLVLGNLLLKREHVMELLKEKIRDISGLKKVALIRDAVNLTFGKNGEILEKIENGHDSLLGLRDLIKNKIDDLVEQQERQARLSARIKEEELKKKGPKKKGAKKE
ncbi:Hypothetical protein BHY_1010 (plasmid) [Borrelia nietonii YOR]|uniref:Uncharacterized protein n=2 Tax=Borrelia TaxID=138 RepID=W5SFR4_9SPIR|nr:MULTISPECIES: hypothetical protein [Borrelia]AHH03961.1 Hypothetical protein BHY_1010 [Borrelia nietonii YOR]AHH14531.1 Hypothetical protein BHW_0026300 [Borrelia hermsii MTW]UPA09805.1 hypothetical protein bhYOR_001112 [Borrelia nietonii YOR]